MTEVLTSLPPIASPAPVKPGLPIKLTTEEMNARYQFIGKCVDRNINYPGSLKFGVSSVMSVQDLCAANIVTLQNIAKSIKKLDADHDPEFNGTEELKINKIPAKDWLEFFRLTIRKKSWDAYASEKRSKVKELNEKIAAAKTPEELRKEAEAELEALKKDFADDEN